MNGFWNNYSLPWPIGILFKANEDGFNIYLVVLLKMKDHLTCESETQLGLGPPLPTWCFRFHLERRVEKWEDGKYLVFPLMCLVGGVEKWEDGKLFCLIGEEKGRMENVIYVN